MKDWHVETGEFEIMIGKSSKEILLKDIVTVESAVTIKKTFTINSTFGDLMAYPVGREIMKAMTLAEPRENDGGAKALGEGFEEMFMATPLRAAVSMSNGEFSEEMLQGILQQVNGSN